MADTKPALLLALGGLKKKPGADDSKSDDGDGSDDESKPDMLAEAKSDVASAFKGGDGAELADAIEQLVRACQSEDY